MSLKLSTDEFNILSNINSLLNSVSIPSSFNSTNAKGNIKNLILSNFKMSILSAALSYNIHNAEDMIKLKELEKNISNDNEKIALILAEGLGVAFTLGYFQLLNNDIAGEGDTLFGYNDLPIMLKKVLISCGGHYSEEDIKSKLESGLVVKINNVSLEDYFKNELYHQDILKIKDLLLSNIDDGYNVDLKTALKNNGNIKTSLQKFLKDLKAIYNIIFADGFGTKPYVGVLLNDSEFLTIKSDMNTCSVNSTEISEGSKILALLANKLYTRLKEDMKFSDKRQFDFAEIYNSPKPVYFPRKILEYTLGRESTLNITRNGYKLSSNSLSWEAYSEAYVFPNLEEVLVRGYYYAFEKYLLDKKIISNRFVDSSFMSETKVKGYDNFIDEHLSSALKDILDFGNKLVASMNCVCILTKYPYIANEITAIYLRMSKFTNSNSISADSSFSSYLFKNLLTVNENEFIKSPFLLTEGEKNADGVALSIDVVEVQYDINPKLSKAEPLFGYVVQKQNQIKGKEANWDNILLGESPTGKEVYASKTSSVKLQNAYVHNIYAGSRAGKGVMTMNILVNALASGKPVFYIDRKPDMAAMLYNIVGDKQFIVNGGLINAEFDIYGDFDEQTGEALKYFREITLPYLESHKEIKDLFGTSYSGKLGDYIYFRAWFFVMGIMVCRAMLGTKNNNIRKTELNGDNGIILVVDELTGAQGNIGPLLGGDSTLFQKAAKAGSVEDINNRLKNLDKEILLAQIKLKNVKAEDKQAEIQFKIESLEEAKASIVKYDVIYASTLFSKIRRSWDMINDNKVASFKDKEFLYSDVFVLGQQLDAKYVTNTAISEANASLSFGVVPVNATKNDAGNTVHKAAFTNSCLIRSVFEEFGDEDWFIGRNNGGLNYANKLNDPVASQVTGVNGSDPDHDTGDGNWVYVGSNTCAQITMRDKANFHYVPFKPYLVLNTNDEGNPPTEGSGVYQYVAQCAKRVNKTAGGINLWDTVRLKHLTPIAKENYTETEKQYGNLEKGVGFKGLVEETLKTTKEGRKILESGKSIDEYINEALSKSGDMANFVARKMGKSCWQELIFDLSPDGLFSFEDMLNALLENGKYTDEVRLETFVSLGLLNESVQDDTQVGESFDDRFGNMFSETNNSDESENESSESITDNTSNPTPTSPDGYTNPGDLLESMRNQAYQSEPEPELEPELEPEEEPEDDDLYGMSEDEEEDDRIPDNVLLSFCEQFADDKIELYKYKYPNKPLSSKHREMIVQTYYETFRGMGY